MFLQIGELFGSYLFFLEGLECRADDRRFMGRKRVEIVVDDGTTNERQNLTNSAEKRNGNSKLKFPSLGSLEKCLPFTKIVNVRGFSDSDSVNR